MDKVIVKRRISKHVALEPAAGFSRCGSIGVQVDWQRQGYLVIRYLVTSAVTRLMLGILQYCPQRPETPILTL
jgi:hypothetical protein